MTAQRQRAEEPSHPGPPPFAGVAAEEPRCQRCDRPLSHYNRRADNLCEACAGRLRRLDGESLATLVAGILLTEIALRPPGGPMPIDLRERLLDLGIRADSTQINEAVRKCRRRRLGLVVTGERRRRGYEPVKVEIWRRPRKKPRRSRKAAR